MSDISSPHIFDINEADFATAVVEKSKKTPVIVDFWAPWCGPCRMLAPMLEKIVNEQNGEVLLAKVNTDENQQVAMMYMIQSLPTVMAFKDGQPFLKFSGVIPEESIREFVKQLLPTEAEHTVDQAKSLEESNPEQAEVLYRQALNEDQRLDEAMIGLARVLITTGKDVDEAAKLLENAAATGELAEEAERLRGILDLSEKAKDAGDLTSAQAKVDADPENAEARYELGCALAAHGKFPEALEMLLSAGEKDYGLLQAKVRPTMVDIFHMIGNRSELADEYRQRLTTMLY